MGVFKAGRDRPAAGGTETSSVSCAGRVSALRGEPTAVVVFVLAIETAAVGLLVVLADGGVPVRCGLGTLGWVAASALITTEASVRVERWRAQHRCEIPHRDLFGPWLITAAIACHPVTAALLAAVLYAWSWTRALHTTVAAHRWTFSAATTVLGTGLAALAAGHLSAGEGGGGRWAPGVVAMAVMVSVNLTLVAAVIVLAHPGTGPRHAVGDGTGFAVEVAACSLGVLLAAGPDPMAIVFGVPVVLVLQQVLVLLTHARDQARTDPKTGLATSTWWRELTERELHRAARTGEPVAVMIADLDHFKQLNDTHGHLVGDQVLTAVAAALTHGLRASDTVGRFGGEEFVITLANTDLDHATATAERLRTRIATLTEPTPPGTPLPHVTVSIGIAIHPHHGTTVDALLTAADTALYTAKHDGRDTVRVAHRDGRHVVTPDVPRRRHRDRR